MIDENHTHEIALGNARSWWPQYDSQQVWACLLFFDSAGMRW